MPSRAFPERMLARGRSLCAGTIIRARAPLRISFVGGGTDLPHYYERHGGAVLSSTITRYAFATLHPHRDDEVRIRALDSGWCAQFRLHDEGGANHGLFDLVQMAIRRMGADQGFELDL